MQVRKATRGGAFSSHNSFTNASFRTSGPLHGWRKGIRGGIRDARDIGMRKKWVPKKMPIKASECTIWVPKNEFLKLVKGKRAIVHEEVFGEHKIQSDETSLGVSSKIIVEANNLLSPSKKEFVGSFSDVGCLVENNLVFIS